MKGIKTMEALQTDRTKEIITAISSKYNFEVKTLCDNTIEKNRFFTYNFDTNTITLVTPEATINESIIALYDSLVLSQYI
jgi:hypothetical protein